MDSVAPSILPPWVQIPSTPSKLFPLSNFVLYLSLCWEKDENKQKEARFGLFFFKKDAKMLEGQRTIFRPCIFLLFCLLIVTNANWFKVQKVIKNLDFVSLNCQEWPFVQFRRKELAIFSTRMQYWILLELAAAGDFSKRQ